MNTDQIMNTRSFFIVEEKYIFAFIACCVLAVFVLVAAAVKIATLVDLDGARKISAKEPFTRTVHVSSEGTQTERNLNGALHSDEGLAVENEDGALYFVEEQTGTRYGPVLWRELHSRVASNALKKLDDPAEENSLCEVIVEKVARHSLLQTV